MNDKSEGKYIIMKIVAGIVLFNPNLDRLVENLYAVCPQVQKVVLVENGSDNREDIKKLLESFENIDLICNTRNMGIAYALNQIGNYAKDNNYAWMLALDQDSVIKDGLIEKYCECLENASPNTAMLTCRIEDRNFEFEEKQALNKTEEVEFCITSASLLKTEAWEKVGGYDQELFIDKVDTDMCWNLIENGWKIIKIDYVGVLHEIGNKTKRINFLGKQVTIFNHSPFRCYYIVRNGIYCAEKHKKYRDTRQMKKSSFNRILLCMLFENQKIQKLVAGVKGIADGYAMAKGIGK